MTQPRPRPRPTKRVVRPSPMCRAGTCPNRAKRGNDGNLWTSRQISNGSFRWFKNPSKAKPTKKSVASKNRVATKKATKAAKRTRVTKQFGELHTKYSGSQTIRPIRRKSKQQLGDERRKEQFEECGRGYFECTPDQTTGECFTSVTKPYKYAIDKQMKSYKDCTELYGHATCKKSFEKQLDSPRRQPWGRAVKCQRGLQRHLAKYGQVYA